MMPSEAPTSPEGSFSSDGSVEGLEESGGSWGDYPLDELLIRHDHRTVHDVLRRIEGAHT